MVDELSTRCFMGPCVTFSARSVQLSKVVDAFAYASFYIEGVSSLSLW